MIYNEAAYDYITLSDSDICNILGPCVNIDLPTVCTCLASIWAVDKKYFCPCEMYLGNLHQINKPEKEKINMLK